MNKKIIFSVLTIFLLIIIIVNKNSFVPLKSYWLSQNKKIQETRTPSSITNKRILSNIRKYLDYNSYNNLINYKLNVMLRTNNVIRLPNLKIKELINKIDLENYKYNFKKIKDLLKKSHSSLILTFFPIYNSHLDLNNELVLSNVLILKNEVKHKNIKNLPQSIYDISLPYSVQNHEYRGGQIIYSPNEIENTPLIQFKLFVNSNQMMSNFKSYSNKFLKLNKLAGSSSQMKESFFMTIDSIFRKNNTTNELTNKQIFKFGVIENFNKEKISTKTPFILGQYKFKGMWIDFKLTINQLSIQNMTIIKKETNLKVILITSKPNLPTEYITNKIKEYLYKNFRKTLNKFLRLQEFNE